MNKDDRDRIKFIGMAMFMIGMAILMLYDKCSAFAPRH